MNDESMNDEVMEEERVIPFSPKLVKSHRELNTYKRAYRTALDIHHATLKFPKIEQFALADQLRRASKSVCANTAEGFARQKYSTKEFARFLTVSEASAQETQVWLEFAKDLGYIAAEEYVQWQDDFQAVAAMINKMIAKL